MRLHDIVVLQSRPRNEGNWFTPDQVERIRQVLAEGTFIVYSGTYTAALLREMMQAGDTATSGTMRIGDVTF